MELEVKRTMSEDEIQRAIENVKANFAIEGLELPEETIALGEKFLRGEITSEQAMRTLIENYGEES